MFWSHFIAHQSPETLPKRKPRVFLGLSSLTACATFGVCLFKTPSLRQWQNTQCCCGKLKCGDGSATPPADPALAGGDAGGDGGNGEPHRVFGVTLSGSWVSFLPKLELSLEWKLGREMETSKRLR